MMPESASKRQIPHGDSFKPPPSKRYSGDRKRQTQACDQCRKGKKKCSGNKPCTNCHRDNLLCSYDAPYTRGARPPIKSNPMVLQNSGYTSFFTSVNTSTNSSSLQIEDQRQPLPRLGPNSEVLANTQMTAAHQQGASSKSDGKLLSGPQRVPVTAFGDLPMPIHRTTMIALPSYETGERLVDIYFEQVSPSILFLHIPTVEDWAVELLSEDGNVLNQKKNNIRNAIVLLVFASAQALNSASEATDKSLFHYQLANEQLDSEIGPPQTGSIQARLLKCYYLLARGRINQCANTFGEVVGLIYKLGLHRLYKKEGGFFYTMLEVECQKRVFWAAFTLDTYLSYALNRPKLLQLGDIDQDIPAFIDDKHLAHGFLHATPPYTLCPNFASNLHVELSIIISQILKNVYGIRKPSGDQYVQIASMHLDLEAYTKDKNEAKQQESTQGAHDEAYLVHRTDADTTRNMDLKAWKERAGPLLDAASETLTELQNHQRVELLLAYHHAQILLLRPFLLDYEIGDADVISAEDRMVDSLVDACKAVCQLLEPRAGDNHTSYSAFVKSPAFQSAWSTQYIIYTTACCTYLMSHRDPSNAIHPRCTILKKSQFLHKLLKDIAQQGTFIGQCVEVLDEFKLAVDEEIEKVKGRASSEDEDEDEDEEMVDGAGGRETMIGSAGDEQGSGGTSAGVGKIPLMERIKYWGFARLTGFYI